MAIMVNLDIPTLNLVVGVIIPLLVGVVTKLKASAGVKAVVNAGLSAVASAAVVLIETDGAILAKTLLISFLTTWGVSILTYYGLWKPTGVSTTVQTATKNVGIGTPTLEPDPRIVPYPLMFQVDASGGAFTPTGWQPGDPPLGELADADDELDGCEIDMAAHAIPEGTEAFYAMSPDGDEEKLKEYDLLFNGPKAGS